jgi:hypothetical protein
LTGDLGEDFGVQHGRVFRSFDVFMMRP